MFLGVMDDLKLIQIAIVRVDMALVAAWHILKIALRMAIMVAIVVMMIHMLRQGR